MSSTLLPAPIATLLATAYPAQAITDVRPTYGGFSNITLALSIAGVPHIVKASERPEKQADLRREARIVHLLADTGLPIPRCMQLIEADGWTIEVLGMLPGQNGIQHLVHTAGADPVPLFGALGALLRQVHAVRLPVDDPDLALAVRAQAAFSSLPISFPELPPEQLAALQRGLARAIEGPQHNCLLHGDPGAHNLLWDGAISGLLDWEWAAAGDPLADLAWVCWTIRFRAFPTAARVAFLEAYGGPRPDLQALHELALAQIALILTRISHLPEPRAEWLRRLTRTLAW